MMLESCGFLHAAHKQSKNAGHTTNASAMLIDLPAIRQMCFTGTRGPAAMAALMICIRSMILSSYIVVSMRSARIRSTEAIHVSCNPMRALAYANGHKEDRLHKSAIEPIDQHTRPGVAMARHRKLIVSVCSCGQPKLPTQAGHHVTPELR